MVMSIFAVYSIKGGVGKTATAVNLAYLSAQQGYQTLIWDLDPQGASSYYFRVKAKIKGGHQRVLAKKRTLDSLIKGSDFPLLDLLPADFSYRHFDLQLSQQQTNRNILNRILKPLEQDYQHIFLDCPPSISILSENVFNAADQIIVPVIPTTLSLRTLKQLYGFFDRTNLNPKQIKPFFSMVEQRKQLHKKIVLGSHKKYSNLINNFIPYSSEIEQMGIQRAPLASYADKHSTSVQAYEKIWAEILKSV